MIRMRGSSSPSFFQLLQIYIRDVRVHTVQPRPNSSRTAEYFYKKHGASRAFVSGHRESTDGAFPSQDPYEEPHFFPAICEIITDTISPSQRYTRFKAGCIEIVMQYSAGAAVVVRVRGVKIKVVDQAHGVWGKIRAL